MITITALDDKTITLTASQVESFRLYELVAAYLLEVNTPYGVIKWTYMN